MRVIFFIVCFALSFACSAQIDTVRTNKVLITFSPSAFINLAPGVQLGIEKYISHDMTIELEGARLLTTTFTSNNSRGNDAPRMEVKNGTRIKLGFKKYFSERGIFLATLYFRKTNHDFEEWIFQEEQNFSQLINYKSTKTLIGPTIGIGLSSILRNSFHLETAINIGLGTYEVRQSEVPEGITPEVIWGNIYHSTGDYVYPIIGLSLKFKYCL